MANAAAATSPQRAKTEKVVNFVPEAVAAPFFLRCGALFIDYMLLLSVPVFALIGNKFLGDGTYTGPGTAVWTMTIILWVANFLLFPLLRGQTLGKFLTGLTILNQDGTSISLITILRRNVLGYFITAATLGIGFFTSVFSRKGRALHDMVAGTVLIRGRKTISNG